MTIPVTVNTTSDPAMDGKSPSYIPTTDMSSPTDLKGSKMNGKHQSNNKMPYFLSRGIPGFGNRPQSNTNSNSSHSFSVPGLPHINLQSVPHSLQDLTNRVRESLAATVQDMDVADVRARYTDLATTYLSLLVDYVKETNTLEEGKKRAKTLLGNGMDVGGRYVMSAIDVVAEQSERNPWVGIFALVAAAFMAIPLSVFVGFAAVVTTCTVAAAVACLAVLVGGAAGLLGLSLLASLTGAVFFTATSASAAWTYQNAKVLARRAGTTIGKQDLIEELITQVETKEKEFTQTYQNGQRKVFKMLKKEDGEKQKQG